MQMPTGGIFWCLVVYSRGRFLSTTCVFLHYASEETEKHVFLQTQIIHHLMLLYLQVFQNDTNNCKLQLKSLFRWHVC
ncbi:hypothetical protein BHE74_00059405 [Ensete ventricosum]|nr:hypothetical protein BHE74_00059405 [Ensete ventricosum]